MAYFSLLRMTLIITPSTILCIRKKEYRHCMSRGNDRFLTMSPNTSNNYKLENLVYQYRMG